MTLAETLAPRPGSWVRIERTRGSGYHCGCCGDNVQSGWEWFDTPLQSSAFLCDPCVEMIVQDES